MGRGGFPRPGPPGGREGPHQGMGRRRDGGWRDGTHQVLHSRTFQELLRCFQFQPILGRSGKGDRVRGARVSLPPTNHLSPTPGPRVLPGDTVFSRMVISSMAEVAAASPPKTTARPLGRWL